MRILVFEDTQANIEAAKVAAQAHPEHEFIFCTTASEALATLEEGGINGLISDFFSPQEEGRIHELWSEYIQPMRLFVSAMESNQRIADPSDQQILFKFLQALWSREWAWNELFGRQAEDWRSFYNVVGYTDNPDSYRIYGYGGPLMLKAQESGLSSVLVTDMHRHQYDRAGSPFGGVVMLSPLVSAGVCTFEEIEANEGARLLASSGISNISKENPTCWEQAIQKLQAQVS